MINPAIDEPINRSDMPKRLRELLRIQERELNRTCRKLWTFTNPRGERFIFGRFTRDRKALIVTISRYAEGVGWIWPPFHS